MLIRSGITLVILTYLCLPSAVLGQDLTRLGGDLSSNLPGRHAIQVTAPNVTDEERRITQLAGFSVFHGVFNKETGLGPMFNHRACGGRHVENGRGEVKFPRSDVAAEGSQMIVRVSLKGLAANGATRDVPEIGGQLQDHAISGNRRFDISLEWKLVKGAYPDGTSYTLRRPDLKFKLKSRKRAVHSLRMTPTVIGVGLLEAIDEATILALSDPEDSNRDGVSGRPNYVVDVRNNSFALGRFGFKANHPSVEQQSAAAAFNDIGITNSLFPGDTAALEMAEETLRELVVYQQIAGMPLARNQSDVDVQAGQSIFVKIGCATCHVMTLKTSSSAAPELANQEIHPFTDLLLHDMGRELEDDRAEFTARGQEWRTTPLWGLGFSQNLSSVKARFMHDGRARTIEEAILWHGGEGRASRKRFKGLQKSEREQLLKFLRSL